VVPFHPMAYLYMVHNCNRPPARRRSASSCREGIWARTAAAGAGATAITIAMCHADTPSGLNSELRACETLKLSRSQSIAYLEQEAAGCR